MRVVVTGIGVVSPLGRGLDTLFDALLLGRSAVEPLTLFEVAELPQKLAAATDVQAEAGWSRADQMAVLAAGDALKASATSNTSDMALIVAGSTGGTFEAEKIVAALKRDIDMDVDLTPLRAHPLSAAGDSVHERCGPFARVTSVCSACSGGATALMLGAATILSGARERVLAGGVDALCRLTYTGFAALNAMDPAPCRPFDATRAGLSLGEGAAFFVLESAASAQARGAPAWVELAGWAIGSEAHHITHPEPTGETAGEVMRRAIEHASMARADVVYVNAHGTATPHNDPMETQAIRRCFGDDTDRVWVSSTKGAIGHTLGAAGALEAAVAAKAVMADRLPPTAGLSEADPACRLRHVTEAVSTEVNAAMSNAFGFGGTDTTLLFRKAPRTPPVRGVAKAAAKVVITGAACLGPHGVAAGDTLAAQMAPYLAAGRLPDDAPMELPKGLLDAMRARRLDRASRMVTMATQLALGGEPSPGTGIVVGSGHGGVSATTRVLKKIFERGPRFASPAHFPSVLPSAQASHPAIYLGMTGPVFACSDLGTSAEAALLCGIDLLRHGFADCVVAAGVDEHNLVASRASMVVGEIPGRNARSEGAAALVLEHAGGDKTPLAEVASSQAWRGSEPALAAPGDDAAVILVRPGPVPPGWEQAPRHVIADRAGDHESVGGVALVAAVALIASRTHREVLVVGRAPDRGYAFVLREPS